MAHDNWLASLLNRIRRASDEESEVQGALEPEISVIEERYKLRLPEAYRAVLGAIGGRADAFLDRGEFEFFCDQLTELNDAVRLDHGELVKQFVGSSAAWFVVRGRYREQFEFIRCDGSSKTPVFYFNDWDQQIVEAYLSIPAWLTRLCDDELPE